VGGQLVAFGQAHEAGGLAGGEQAGADAVAFDEHDELAAGATGAGAQATAEVVQTDFSALRFDAQVVAADAAVDGADGALAGSLRLLDLFAMDRAMSESRRSVSSGVCHSTLVGCSSIRSSK
jgi:hypothetical protein